MKKSPKSPPKPTKELIIRRLDNEEKNTRFYEGIEVTNRGLKTETEKQLWCYPSVTHILDRSYPMDPHLVDWIRSNGMQGKALFEFAANEGTEVHIIINRLLHYESIDTIGLSPKIKRCVQSFLDWYNEFKPTILETEQIVVNQKEKYAGALDLLCEIEHGKHKGQYVVDFKTSRSVQDKHRVQVSAYWAALGNNKFKTAILHLGNQTNAGYSFLPYDPKDYWKQFDNCNKLYRMMTPNAVPNIPVYPDFFAIPKKKKPVNVKKAEPVGKIAKRIVKKARQETLFS